MICNVLLISVKNSVRLLIGCVHTTPIINCIDFVLVVPKISTNKLLQSWLSMQKLVFTKYYKSFLIYKPTPSKFNVQS